MARSSHETKSLEKYMGKADDLLALVAKSDVTTATHPDPSFNLVTPGSGVLLWITGLVYDKTWLEGSVASNDRADLNLTFPQQFAFSVPVMMCCFISMRDKMPLRRMLFHAMTNQKMSMLVRILRV